MIKTKLNSLWNFKTKILLGCISLSVTSISPCFAQSNIAPDNTLGIEASEVTPNVNNPDGIPSELIEGGAERGQNLFHSLQEFNVNEGRGAYFVVPNDIQNVLTRVTGNNASLINGILGTISNRNFDPTNANLFLINPSGIVFGENATLNVNGSFVGTTANAIEFREQGFFSATNPQAPPLLTVDTNGLLFNQINQNAAIQNNSVADVGLNPIELSATPLDSFTLKGLRVADGNSLLLVGGDINIDGGGLVALGGRVDLAGLAGDGKVGLNVDGNNLSLSIPNDVARADILLTNNAVIDVSAGGGGSIAVNARNLQVRDTSLLSAGIGSGLGTPESQAGDITVNATDIVLFETSFAFNGVSFGGIGKAGDLSITTGSLEVLNGAYLSASIFDNGKGEAGTVTINATDLVKFDEGIDGFSTGAVSRVEPGAKGNAGGVSITTGSLSVTNGAQLDVTTFGIGNAGRVEIIANDFVKFDGEFPTGARSSVGPGAEGNAGGVSITTGALSVLNGARLNASTLGIGDAGSIEITANDFVKFDGGEGILTGALSSVNSTGKGKAGGVSITTGSLSVLNGARLNASTFGIGDAGSVEITANDLVKFDGENKHGSLSEASSEVSSTGKGKAGGVSITTGSLFVLNGAQLGAGTFGIGNAGSVEISANDLVKFDGESKNGTPSGAFSTVVLEAKGDAGGVSITTGSLSVLNGALLDASTRGIGDAGSVEISANDLVKFDGEFRTGARSQVDSGAKGNAGGVSITTGSLSVLNGAQLDASTRGIGNAGSVEITANDLVKFDGSNSGAFSQVESGAEGDAGGVSITTGSLSVLNGAQLSASTIGLGDAGRVEISANDLVKFDGEFPTGAFSRVESGAEGDAGGVLINTGSLSVLNGAQLDASTIGLGNAGSVEITANDLVKFDGESIDGFPSGAFSTVESEAEGDAGGVSITTGSLEVTNGAQLSASTFGEGKGGNLTVNADTLELKDNGIIVAGSRSDSGIAGNIEINLKDNFNADNGRVIT
ncbi:filamentous hemagglutinin N-terminal domain-containing protein [Calothrix sp. CCY 0018]|uniref:two-partner secretion domain-containing protein n=1 Tax=Calothrix sp. CCY 0018 TaxID=3103864 RepID=UPI0039C5F545